MNQELNQELNQQGTEEQGAKNVPQQAKEGTTANDILNEMKELDRVNGISRSEADYQKRLNQTIGNNGRVDGDKFPLTGKVLYKVYEIDGKKVGGWAFELANGGTLSVRAVMGVSSLKGYNTDSKTLKNQYCLEDKADAKILEDDVAPLGNVTVDMFKAGNILYTPPTRNELEFVAYIRNHVDEFKGHYFELVGTLLKPIKAKKKSTYNGTIVLGGFNRVIVTEFFKLI